MEVEGGKEVEGEGGIIYGGPLSEENANPNSVNWVPYWLYGLNLTGMKVETSASVVRMNFVKK